MSNTATVGIYPCGCLCLALTNPGPSPREQREWKKRHGQTLAEALTEGIRLEPSWTPEQVRANPWGCLSCRPGDPSVVRDSARAEELSLFEETP